MKTEPVNALKALQHYDNMDTGCVHVDVELRPIVITAFKEGQSNPKIKQLEWMGSVDLVAKTGIGDYCIQSYNSSQYAVSFQAYYRYVSIELNSIDEAKAAAQEDFEKRVKQCLKL